MPRSPKVCICDKLFPANWLSACHDDNSIKPEVIYSEWREELSCRARDVDHWMMSDVNKWLDLTQSLCQSYVLLTLLYVKRVKTVNWVM